MGTIEYIKNVNQIVLRVLQYVNRHNLGAIIFLIVAFVVPVER